MRFDLTPREFRSELMPIGVAVGALDPGVFYVIGYADCVDPFYARRVFGETSVSEVEWHTGFRPEIHTESASNPTLGGLIRELAQMLKLPYGALRQLIVESVESERADERGRRPWVFLSANRHIESYMLWEAIDGGDPMTSGFSRLMGDRHVPWLPSKATGEGTVYSGLELRFDEEGWHASLFEPDRNHPDIDTDGGRCFGESFDKLLNETHGFSIYEDGCLGDVVPWTREELVAKLIEHDATWRLWCALGSPTPNEDESCAAETRVDSVLLHIPHSSTVVPDDVRAGLLIDAEELERELSAMTDRHTDELFSAEGADRLVFGFSRLVVDPERFEDDAQEPMSALGMGAVYTRTSTGKPLRSGADRAELMARYYEPHHRRLNEWAEAALARHGCCLVIDCHSFPSSRLACDLDPLVERPMFCVGTDPFHTPPALRDAVDVGLRQIANEMLDIRDARDGRKPRFANRMKRVDQAVLVDRPYAGTMVPSKFYGADARVASVMIEVNRGLYMDEATGMRTETYALLRRRLMELLEGLVWAWREQVVR